MKKIEKYLSKNYLSQSLREAHHCRPWLLGGDFGNPSTKIDFKQIFSGRNELTL
jgi:hypothetical protein